MSKNIESSNNRCFCKKNETKNFFFFQIFQLAKTDLQKQKTFSKKTSPLLLFYSKQLNHTVIEVKKSITWIES